MTSAVWVEILLSELFLTETHAFNDTCPACALTYYESISPFGLLQNL